VDYKQFIKKFTFGPSFHAPSEFGFDDLKARPLTRVDLKADMEAVNSSLELIRKTRGGSWPAEAVSEEFDFLDLAWHEREFRDGGSFAYVIYTNHGKYIGCFYLYPMGHRTELTSELVDYDIDASWWVTSEAYQQGYYQKVHTALHHWLREFPVTKVYYSNKEIPS